MMPAYLRRLALTPPAQDNAYGDLVHEHGKGQHVETGHSAISACPKAYWRTVGAALERQNFQGA